MKWIYFTLTVISALYASYCYRQWKNFELGFMLLAKTMNPKSEDDCDEILRKMQDEYNKLKNTDSE